MSHLLSLHHVTVMDVGPAELVSIAAQVGCQHVCFFTHVAPEAQQLFPCVWDEKTLAEVALRCADTGVSANSLEYFDVYPEVNLDIYRKGLEIGARLGARCATTHVKDTDPQRAIDNFARFCDIAAEFDISAAIEFTTLAGPDTIGAARAIIAGAGRSNGGIALDTLHLFRSGGTVGDVAGLDPRLIKSVQLSDGPMHLKSPGDYLGETLFERQIPGGGEFPLRDLRAYIPSGMVVDVEVPLQSHRERGVSALERARLAVNGARSVLAM
ncbi:sugar phosphate isomerase/epimerase family protein [Pseudomonas sp. LB3P14]